MRGDGYRCYGAERRAALPNRAEVVPSPEVLGEAAQAVAAGPV